MIQNLVHKGMTSGQQFSCTGAVDGIARVLTVKQVTMSSYHKDGQKVLVHNVVAINDRNEKVVFGLDVLVALKAQVVN